jgi:trimeric autotransporter adhesin
MAMKTKIIFSILLSFSFCILFSQVPQGFNYQAIARDGTGAVLADHLLPVRITIQTSLTGGITIWEETHSVTTNQFGVMVLIIGNGTRTGGSVPLFSGINWGSQLLYLKTEVDPGTGFIPMGTTQLWSVPYSILAKNIEGPLQKLNVTGTTPNMDEALFEVKNKFDQTVFAVYNEGVRVYVSDGDAKGAKGGFAIGSMGVGKATPSQKYLMVKPDTIRFYIDDRPGKGNKGGFAIGGYGEAKGGLNFLNVSPDSTRIFTGDSKKGFGVGSISTGFSESYLKLTPENYFIGYNSGRSISSGKYNSFMGYEAGKSNTSGTSNIFIGFNAGSSNTIGNSNMFMGNNSGITNLDGSTNIFIGKESGWSNENGNRNIFIGEMAGYSNIGAHPYNGWQGSDNIFLGPNSGKNNTSGAGNIFIGTSSGFSNKEGNLNIFIGPSSGFASTGMRNTFIGVSTGENNSTGEDNIFIGNQTGQNSTKGAMNTFLGSVAGLNNGDGMFNTFIGYNSGSNLISGDNNVLLGSNTGGSSGNNNVFVGYNAGGGVNTNGNVFIGYTAGIGETNSNRLYIDNRDNNKDNALIYGEFDSDVLAFNASVGIGNSTPAYKLDISGNTRITNDTYLATSSGNVGIGTTSPEYKLTINGTAWSSSGSWTGSDIRWKKNISDFNNALIGILELNTVCYNLKTDEFPEMNFDSGNQIGLIAQDVEKVFPQLVRTDDNGFKAVAYDRLSAILVEAVKEQHNIIEKQDVEIQSLKARLDKIEEKMTMESNK